MASLSVPTIIESYDDFPGPRSGHTLTTVDYRLVLFGGMTTGRSGGSVVPPMNFECVTNSVYIFNTLDETWTRVYPDGQAPSPRLRHAAVASGKKVFIQGGLGPAGCVTGDLFILDMARNKFKWQRVVPQGVAPGPRYGHGMGLVHHKLVLFGGNDGNEILADTWTLNTTQPDVWEKLNLSGNRPSERMYASVGTGTDQSFVLCGRRDDSGASLGDATSDWRTRLLASDVRQRVVYKIFDTLNKLRPASGAEDLLELQRIASKFEEHVFNTASTQGDYAYSVRCYRKLKMVTNFQPAAGSSSTTRAANNTPPLDSVDLNTDDWRTQLPPDSRQKNVEKMMDMLRKHVPNSGLEGINKLMSIAAASFEEFIFSTAINQVDYIQKVSFKIQAMEESNKSALEAAV